MVWLEGTLITVAAWIAWQDFDQRAVRVSSLLAFAGLAILYGSLRNPPLVLAWQAGINFIFLTLQFFLLLGYHFLRNRSWTGFVDTQLGLGDIFFVIPVTFLFPPTGMILFYAGSLLLILVTFLLWKALFRPGPTTVPLAGGMACCLIGVLLISRMGNIKIAALFGTGI